MGRFDSAYARELGDRSFTFTIDVAELLVWVAYDDHIWQNSYSMRSDFSKSLFRDVVRAELNYKQFRYHDSLKLPVLQRMALPAKKWPDTYCALALGIALVSAWTRKGLHVTVNGSTGIIFISRFCGAKCGYIVDPVSKRYCTYIGQEPCDDENSYVLEHIVMDVVCQGIFLTTRMYL
jgi:hypothetical protein